MNNHTGRIPSELEGSDLGDDSIGQGTPQMASKPSEARREAWNRYSVTTLRRNEPGQLLDLGLLGSE